MILQVHDELVFDIPKKEQALFEKLVREVMEGVLTTRVTDGNTDIWDANVV